MVYCTESQVFDICGLSSSKLQSVLGLSEAEVSTLVESHIAWAERHVKDLVRLPIVVRRELHLGDGEKYSFDLGPEDEDYSIDYDPVDDVTSVFAVYLDSKRVKLPFPKDDCDLGCENESSDWDGNNCTISDEETIVASGEYAIKGVFSSAGYMRYPSTTDLNKNIDIYKWVAFRFRTDDATKTFTVKLYDRSGNANTYDFTVHKADVWYVIMIQLDDFTGDVDWNEENLYYLDIYSNGACTVYICNLNFNDDFMWTIPQGDIVYMTKIIPTYSAKGGHLPDNYIFKVTYAFDPFNTTVPANIAEACACFAGARTFDTLMGRRVQSTGFVLQAPDGSVTMDKFTMSVVRKRLIERGNELVGLYGFGFDGGIA